MGASRQVRRCKGRRLITQTDQLKALVKPQSTVCTCTIGACAGWQSMTEDRWPTAQMQACATLRDPDVHEPTFEEHHPHGTRYDSPKAPIALHYYPYNRCDVFQCGTCQRTLLRYTEFGGYYVDHRVRALDAALVV
jgi:hypothetical protein